MTVSVALVLAFSVLVVVPDGFVVVEVFVVDEVLAAVVSVAFIENTAVVLV